MKILKYTVHFIVILFSLNNQVFAQQPASLDFVIHPYIQEITADSFQVLWETSSEAKGQLHLAKSKAEILKPELTVVAAESNPLLFHKLSVKGLNKNELYYYQVLNIGLKGDTLRGPITPITLPNYDQSPISFTVVGDTQGNPQVWKRIVELMSEEAPQFIVHAGDLVQYGPNKDDWTDEFFYPAKGLLSNTPLYPANGNHEMNDEKFYNYFNLPYDNAFYSIKKGDLILIFVDTNKDVLPGSEQYRKLEKLLASSLERWKIVVHHHPLLTSDKFSYRSSLLATATKGDPNILHLKNLYETYDVDLTLTGHVHDYERSWPVWKNHINEEKGVVHIVTGGGGGNFKKVPNDDNWFSAKSRNVHHFLNIQLSGDKLHIEAIDTTGVLFDTWEKEKKDHGQRFNAPFISAQKQYFIDSTAIVIRNLNTKGSINYRLNDEGYKTAQSKEKTKVLKNTTTVSALVSDVNSESKELVKTFIKLPIKPKQKAVDKKVMADYYEGYFTVLPDFEKLKPTRTFTVDSLSISEIKPRAQDHFAVRFKGTILIPDTDVYRFFLESFDGSSLLIDGEKIIDNDGVHYEIFKEAYVALEKGFHSIEVQYFDYERRETLNLLIGKNQNEMQDINTYINSR